MVTTPTIGQLNWGPPLNAALNDLQAQIDASPPGVDWVPAEQGFMGWPFDPAVSSGSQVLTAGTLTIMRISVRAAATANSLWIAIATAGAGLTAGQNFAGLYNTAGTLLAQTADQSAVWNSTGTKQMNLTVPVGLSAGQYLLALLANGATPPAPIRGLTSGVTNAMNAGLTGATLRFANFGAGLTALPASFAPAAMTAMTVSYWSAIKA